MGVLPRLTRDELLAALRREGLEVSERRLEDWRARGLIPRPDRSGYKGRSPIWTYPPGTDRQLVAACRWRERTRDLEAIRVALWIEGYAIELESVRPAIDSVLARWAEGMANALAPRVDPRAAKQGSGLESAAAELASRRSRAPVPRKKRMTLPERTRAFAYMLALAAGHEDEVLARREDAPLLERLLGFSRYAGTGLFPGEAHETWSGLPRKMNPVRLRASVREASDEQLGLVRNLLQVALVWLPVLVPVFAASEGRNERPLIELGETLREAPPEVYCLLAAIFASAISDESAIETEVSRLSPAAMDVEVLQSLSQSDRRAAVKHMTAREKERVAAALAKRRAPSADHEN